MSEISESSLKNSKFHELTSEQIIKKYEEVLNSREKQLCELSLEMGKVQEKLENLKLKYQNANEKNTQLKNILQKKESLLKQELDNKEIMFMQLTKKEKESDEITEQIKNLKKGSSILDSEKKKGELKKDLNKGKKEDIKDENKEKNEVKKDDKSASNPKSLAREKINQLTNQVEGMKKINFAELLKKNQEN